MPAKRDHARLYSKISAKITTTAGLEPARAKPKDF